MNIQAIINKSGTGCFVNLADTRLYQTHCQDDEIEELEEKMNEFISQKDGMEYGILGLTRGDLLDLKREIERII